MLPIFGTAREAEKVMISKYPSLQIQIHVCMCGHMYMCIARRRYSMYISLHSCVATCFKVILLIIKKNKSFRLSPSTLELKNNAQKIYLQVCE